MSSSPTSQLKSARPLPGVRSARHCLPWRLPGPAALHIEKIFGITIDPARPQTDETLGEIVTGIPDEVREATPGS